VPPSLLGRYALPELIASDYAPGSGIGPAPTILVLPAKTSRRSDFGTRVNCDLSQGPRPLSEADPRTDAGGWANLLTARLLRTVVWDGADRERDHGQERCQQRECAHVSPSSRMSAWLPEGDAEGLRGHGAGVYCGNTQQLAYRAKFSAQCQGVIGGRARARTVDPLIKSLLFYTF
jgi:hypothetical protein